MARQKREKTFHVRVTEEEKKWFEDMAEEYETTEAEVFRFLFYFDVGTRKPKERKELLKKLPYQLAEILKQIWAENDLGKQKLKKTG